MEKELIKDKIIKLVNHYHNKNFDYVIKEGQIILKKIPKNIFLINLIALSFQAKGNLKLAYNGYVEIINLDNKNKEAYNNLGTVFKTLKNYEDAKKNFEKSLEVDPKFVDALTNLGNLHFELNDYENAINILKRALSINNNNALAHYNLGLIYQSIGEQKKAIAELEKVLEINPANTNADKLLSRITKYDKDHKHLKEMEKKGKELELSDFQKIQLYFSLGKAFEDIKNYDESFKYLKLANDLKKKLLNYNLKNEKEIFKTLKNFFKDFNLNQNNEIKSKKEIIFIVGLPRSGTSLIEQILSTHTKVYSCGELSFITDIIEKNFFSGNSLDSSKLKNLSKTKMTDLYNDYINHVEKFKKDSLIYTDKAPLNFIWLGIIKMLIPDAKIIHCKRNPKDNILSLYKNDFDGRLNFTYDYHDLFEFYKEYLELIKFWKSILHNQIYEAEYEKIIQDPEDQIEKLLKFCRLEFEQKCLKFYENKRPIKTVSSHQARQPLYDSSISSYKNYEMYMKDIFSKIEKLK